jgi:flagellar biosynthetic protein FliP
MRGALAALLGYRPSRRVVAMVALGTCLALLASGCVAADGSATVPNVGIGPQATKNPGGAATGVQLLVLLTTLSLAPALLVMVTSFTRIIVVLSLVRNAIGVPQLPPNQVLLGMGFLLTVFVMAPVWTTVNKEALQPYLAGQLSQSDALSKAEQPVRKFMLAQTRESDLALFVGLSQDTRPNNVSEIPTYVIIPAFIISELKTAFLMGFIIFVPFLIIDIVVSSALLSMGMMMLPPVVVSLPFKILLFVLVDGWSLIIGSLVTSFVTKA